MFLSNDKKVQGPQKQVGGPQFGHAWFIPRFRRSQSLSHIVGQPAVVSNTRPAWWSKIFVLRDILTNSKFIYEFYSYVVLKRTHLYIHTRPTAFLQTELWPSHWFEFETPVVGPFIPGLFKKTTATKCVAYLD